MERYALYYAPTDQDPLWAFGCGVIGRDAVSGTEFKIMPELRQSFPDWQSLVVSAAHYGFHATLKAPFELAAGVDMRRIKADLATVCAALAPVQLGRMKVAHHNRFAVLMPSEPPPDLGDLADTIVRDLDHLRAPLAEADRARRAPDQLTQRQQTYLERWGYPYVFEEFRFHMTLAGPLSPIDLEPATVQLADHYRSLDAIVTIRDVCLFKQITRQAPFLLVHRQALGG